MSPLRFFKACYHVSSFCVISHISCSLDWTAAVAPIQDIIASGDLLKSTSADVVMLSTHAPLFWGVLAEIEEQNLVSPHFCVSFRTLMKICLEVRQNWFPGAEPNHGPIPQPQGNDPIGDFFRFGHFFPSHPVVRGLGLYAVDAPAARKDAIIQSSCKKEATPATRLTRVLFPFICLDCEQCFGFSCIDAYESPRAVFDVIFMRFAEAPLCVVYDNACHLSLYCALREPWFFQNVLFIIDRFHAKNHKLDVCSAVHNAAIYPSLNDYNTQLMEQFNSRFDALSVALGFCAPGAYFVAMVVAVFKDNRDREINLRTCPFYRRRTERARALAEIEASDE